MILPDENLLVACNGLTPEDLATCESWKISNDTQTWRSHSQPNKGDYVLLQIDKLKYICISNDMQPFFCIYSNECINVAVEENHSITR